MRQLLEEIVLSEMIQSLHDSPSLSIKHSQMWSNIRNKGTYLRNRNRVTDIENRPMVAEGEGAGEGMEGVWGWQRQPSIYRMDTHQGPLVKSRESYSISFDQPSWKRMWKRPLQYSRNYHVTYQPSIRQKSGPFHDTENKYGGFFGLGVGGESFTHWHLSVMYARWINWWQSDVYKWQCFIDFKGPPVTSSSQNK